MLYEFLDQADIWIEKAQGILGFYLFYFIKDFILQNWGYILIALLNFIVYRKAVYFNLINDDYTDMKLNPFKVRYVKKLSIILHTLVCEYIHLAFGFPGLIAALMFSVHPLAIQIPVWWTGREYGKNALLALQSIVFTPFGSLILLAANISIPTTLFLPLIFLFTKAWYLSLIFPITVLFSWKKLKRAIRSRAERHEVFSSRDDFKIGKFKWENLIIVVKTFGYYALASLLPIKNGFYNSFLVTLGSSVKETKYWYSLNRHFWGGIFAIVFMAVTWWFNKFNFIGMGILIFGLSLGPYLNFITVQMWTSPRYAYLAVIGFQLALAGILLPLGTIGYCILSALFLFYLDRTIKVMQIYKTDNITQMILDSQVFPDNPRLWYYRYEHMLHKDNALMAWAEATYGLKYLPEDCQLWFGLACASFELGDLNAASTFLKNAENYMILSERENMRELIAEFKERIKNKLLEKYTQRRF